MSVVVYPGTFDPITLGHEAIVLRASRLFGRVVVAVAEGVHKRTEFALDARVEMAREVLSVIPNVEVAGFRGLLLDFMATVPSRIIVRGLRAVSDFEYEFQLAGMNRQLDPQVETIFLVPDERHQFVSSSMVREIASLGGHVAPFVNERLVSRIQKIRS